MITEQDVKRLFEARLPELVWQRTGSDFIGSELNGYTLHVTSQGWLYIYKSGNRIAELQDDKLKLLYNSQMQVFKQRDLKELAECFKPAPLPTGTESLLADDEAGTISN